MPHNSLINGASHSLNGAQTIINGTGYKINSGKTLINGTGRNINFALPLKWRWNETLSWPFASSNMISIKFNNDQRFESPGFSGYGDFDELLFSRTYNSKGEYYISNMSYGSYTSYANAYQFESKFGNNQWVYADGTGRIITFKLLTNDWLIAYLQANATPIYN